MNDTKMISQDEYALLCLMDHSLEALNAMDVEKLLSLHTDSVILMEPNVRAIEGKEKVRELFRKMEQKDIRLQLAYNIHEVEVSGSLGFVRGQVIKTTIEEKGESEEHTGKFICLCQKQADGQWLRTHVIVNSDEDVNWMQRLR